MSVDPAPPHLMSDPRGDGTHQGSVIGCGGHRRTRKHPDLRIDDAQIGPGSSSVHGHAVWIVDRLAYPQYGLTAGNVTVVHISDDEYTRVAEVMCRRGDTWPAAPEKPHDGDNIMWQTQPGAFVFSTQKSLTGRTLRRDPHVIDFKLPVTRKCARHA